MKKKKSFSKVLLIMESAVVLYTSRECVALAHRAIEMGYAGGLGWLTAMVSAAWGAYGASAAFYYNKAKAENTVGGIIYELNCRGTEQEISLQQDCESI